MTRASVSADGQSPSQFVEFKAYCFTCRAVVTAMTYRNWSGEGRPAWCTRCNREDVEAVSERIAEVLLDRPRELS